MSILANLGVHEIEAGSDHRPQSRNPPFTNGHDFEANPSPTSVTPRAHAAPEPESTSRTNSTEREQPSAEQGSCQGHGGKRDQRRCRDLPPACFEDSLDDEPQVPRNRALLPGLQSAVIIETLLLSLLFRGLRLHRGEKSLKFTLQVRRASGARPAFILAVFTPIEILTCFDS